MRHTYAPLLVLLLAALVEANELVSLKDGTSYVGEVKEVTDTHVTVLVEFPARQTKRIAREDLTDRTLWRILSRRTDLSDAKAWVVLGGWAETRGLLVPALIAYGRAAKEATHAEQANKRIVSIETRLAQALFDRGEKYFIGGRPASAMRYFEILVARYPSTPVAPIAKTRLEQIRARIAASRSAAKEARAQAMADKALWKARRQWDDEIDAIQGHLKDAAAARAVGSDRSRPVRTGRALERAVHHLEAAWRRARDLGKPPDGVAPEEAAQLENDVKSRLVRAYLDTGVVYLMRSSLPQAEEYCTKACDLDPENAATHTLHEKIIYARLNSDWWTGGFFGRRRR